jgi:D-sedoheptulose 7-phosphate isomerase
MDAVNYYKRLAECISRTEMESIALAVEIIKSKAELGRWIFTCGNGGSASTASHYVTDWGKMRWVNKSKKFKAMCLSDNIGMLTAYGNDLAYEETFSNSLLNYSEAGDLVIFVSGSGNSSNVVKACSVAREHGVETMCVVGYDGGKLAQMCDYVVHFPINDMQICEDLHLSFGHIVMKAICD